MITTDMRLYNYLTFGEDNGYGQPQLKETPEGQIKMAINISSQAIQDNILYKDCTYIGLTMDNSINDNCVILFGDARLKVLYINPKGRYKQVFLKEM